MKERILTTMVLRRENDFFFVQPANETSEKSCDTRELKQMGKGERQIDRIREWMSREVESGICLAGVISD